MKLELDHALGYPPQGQASESDPVFWTSDALAQLLWSTPMCFGQEKVLQDRIEALFKAKGVAYEREVRLSPKDQIDFIVGSIGLEVKLALPASTVKRQLLRYAQSERVASLLLVTTRSAHQALLGETLNGKPVQVVYLQASILF